MDTVSMQAWWVVGIVVVLALVALAAYFLYRNDSPAGSPSASATSTTWP